MGQRKFREDKLKLIRLGSIIRGSESEGSGHFKVTEPRIFHSLLLKQPIRALL